MMKYFYQFIDMLRLFFSELLKIIRKHKYTFYISLLLFFIVFGVVYTCRIYDLRVESAKQKAEQVIEKWNQEDIEWLADTFQTENNQLEINTGFQQESIKQVFNDIVYNSTGIIKNVEITHNNNQVKAKVRIMIETYDSMELMKTLLSSMVNDTSKITYNYTEDDFVNKHAKKLKENLNDFSRDFMDVQFLLMTLNPDTQQWEMNFEENKEFFNSLSGNMFSYMQKREVEGL